MLCIMMDKFTFLVPSLCVSRLLSLSARKHIIIITVRLDGSVISEAWHFTTSSHGLSLS